MKNKKYMHLWEVWKPYEPREQWVVTEEKELSEAIKVLKENGYSDPENIKYIKRVMC